jgi:hypothetical protein
MSEKPTKLELVASPTPDDAIDIEALWMDPALGDGLTDTSWTKIPIDKPRDFFRVHPDPSYRRRTEVYTHKVEGEPEETHYIIAPSMRGRLMEARPCILAACVYRDGRPRLWPLKFPRDGEKDNTAWTSARSCARAAIDKWVKVVWVKGSYQARDAQPGYAPDPDWKKLPEYNELVRLATGPHGIIRDTAHPMYRELMGAPATINDDGL